MKWTIMRFGRKAIVASFTMTLLSATCIAADMNSSLRDFLAKNFPNNRFIATPYGADSRYSPRTMWVELDNVQKTGNSTTKVKAWVAFSDGLSVFPDTAVKVRREAIDVRGWELDSKTKLAIAASLAGTIDAIPIDAKADFVHTNDLVVDIDFGNVEVEYVFYADLLLSQKIYQQNLDALTELMKVKGKELPQVRVIASSLRIKGAHVSAKRKTGTEAGFDAKLSQLLATFGLHYNGQKGLYESLHVADWRYIAFEALLTDRKSGKVSTGSVALKDEAVGPSWNVHLIRELLDLPK